MSPDDEHASAAQGLPLGGASGLKYSARQILQPILSSVNPELRPFKAHEGKMIQYAGWADTAIAPENGLNYYRKVTQTIGDPRDFYRIFMVPGMAHCSGGAGPNAFGNGASNGPVIDADHNLVKALEAAMPLPGTWRVRGQRRPQRCLELPMRGA